MTTVTEIRQHFPLERATLCLDCDELFPLTGICPACGSEALYSLARFLTRDPRLWRPA